MLYALPPEALSKLEEVKATMAEGNAEAMAGFTYKEQAMFLTMLRRVVDNLSRTPKD
ncbi:hypothetical protein [Mesorhizobium sp. B2-4-6]|uniref:hypothetical protein n=1 Tax=Mesorhizobium sp. B2-4-6 TaxID=2589943 RepID=UPI001AED7F09|nr:hypothetical protein [Mesorhizobium sp. B2-4-6]